MIVVNRKLSKNHYDKDELSKFQIKKSFSLLTANVLFRLLDKKNIDIWHLLSCGLSI